MAITQNHFPETVIANDKLYEIKHQYDAMRDTYLVRCDDGMRTSMMQISPWLIEKQRPIDTITMLTNMHEQQVLASPEYRHPGPSNAELQNPVIMQAWNELQVLMRLSQE